MFKDITISSRIRFIINKEFVISIDFTELVFSYLEIKELLIKEIIKI